LAAPTTTQSTRWGGTSWYFIICACASDLMVGHVQEPSLPGLWQAAEGQPESACSVPLLMCAVC
jgi:hypothetical protein